LKKILWTYRGVSERIGTYRSYQDTPIRQLEYRVRIARESHANRTRTRIEYVSDTGYVGNGPNLGNPAHNNGRAQKHRGGGGGGMEERRQCQCSNARERERERGGGGGGGRGRALCHYQKPECKGKNNESISSGVFFFYAPEWSTFYMNCLINYQRF
jgi:hypothetical protein